MRVRVIKEIVLYPFGLTEEPLKIEKGKVLEYNHTKGTAKPVDDYFTFELDDEDTIEDV
jgi:hypothetical protein